MFAGNFTSSKEILEMVYTTFQFDSFNLQPYDAISWIGDAYHLLKVPAYYTTKITDGNPDLNHPDYLEVKDFKAKLPCDVYSIIQVARAVDCFEVDGYNPHCITFGGIVYFDPETDTTCTSGSGTGLCSELDSCNSCSECGSKEPSCSCKSPKRSYYLYPMRWSTNTFHLKYHCSDLDYRCDSGLTYTINNSHIFTSFKEGKLCVAYRAVPTDTEGYPLIPDWQSAKNYFMWYVAKQIAFQLYLQDKYTENKLEHFTSNMQLWYAKAKNEAKMFRTLDHVESFKNDRIRMLPKVNSHRNFFSNLQQPEQWINQPFTYNRNI